MNKLAIITALLIGLVFPILQATAGGFNLPGPLEELKDSETVLDTVPIKDRYGDFLNDKNTNPFDINTSLITQEITYDNETGNYILTEKIGDEFYRMPTYMTFSEYMEWKAKEQEQAFFGKISGVSGGTRSRSGKVDPISNMNLERNLVD